MPGFAVLHYLREFAQSHVHWVGDAIQPAHPLLPPPQSFPASGSLPVSCLFTSGDQSIGASASSLVLPMNTQGWSPLGLAGLISLQAKRLSGVFSSTTVWEHQFFGTQPSLWFNSYPYMMIGKNHSFDYTDLCWQSDVFAFWYTV